MGNVRAIVDQTKAVKETDDYYAFGARWIDGGSVQSVPANRFRYNGKELQSWGDLGYYDYGARFYNPAVGRFSTQDRFAEKYYPLSSYNYCAGNPINLIDVNGDSIRTIFYNEQGKQMNTIPEVVQNMYGKEFGISVGYNASTEQMYFTVYVDSELSQSSTATKRLVEALTDDSKRDMKHGMIVFGYNLSDYVSGASVNGGSWTSGISNIDLGDFNSDGSLKAFNYVNVPIRSHNLARTFEEEYLGHNYLNSSFDGGPYSLSKVNKESNKYRSERGLPQRLNYGGGMNDIPIYYGNPNDYNKAALKQGSPTSFLKKKPR